eukprot:194174-Chlamydomonas_euryale.AAC.1
MEEGEAGDTPAQWCGRRDGWECGRGQGGRSATHLPSCTFSGTRDTCPAAHPEDPTLALGNLNPEP